MGAYPIQPNLVVYFTDGAAFGYPITLDSPNAKLGSATLASDTTGNLVADVTSQCVKASLSGGYNLLRGTFEAAQATFRIVDPNGDWNPANTSSPYYGYLTPNRKIRFTATTQTTGYFLFSGYITAYNYSYPKNQQIGYVDLVCTDAFRLLNLAAISTVAGTSAGQTTSDRIANILDQVSFPSGMRSLQTGQTTVQADPGTTRTALAAIQNCEFSEQGAFYMDGQGNATFKNRQTVAQAAGKPTTRFANDGTGISYFDFLPAYDDKLIINQATINRVGGTAQTSSNAASVNKYFPHSVNYDNLVAQTDTDTANIAAIYVATRAETTQRIDAMTLDLTTPNYAAGIAAALGFDYFSNVRFINVGQNGTQIDKTLQVVGIGHEITPNTWKTTFTLSEPLVDGLILDSAVYGIIGTGVLSY